MGVVIVCGALLALALVLTVRWRDAELTPPEPPAPDAPPAVRARHYLWWVEIVVATGLACGVLVMGAGGRLAMRLLGATSGDAAQGRLTEADQVVGEITVGGTVGFVLFVGVLSGLVTTALWFAVRRFLPARWPGGLAFGAGLLVLLGTRSDPLRPDNEDFDLLGPWWLAIAAFAALALVYGMALSSFSARLSHAVPVLTSGRDAPPYLLLLLLVPLFPFGLLALVGGVAYVFGGRVTDRVRAALTRPRGLRVARAALAALVLVAAPGFVTAIGDIVGRGT